VSHLCNFLKTITYHYPTFIKDDHDNLREACKNPSCAKQKLKAIKCCHQIQNLNRKLQEDNKQIENELTTVTYNVRLLFFIDIA
jgi:hypothetical protein